MALAEGNVEAAQNYLAKASAAQNYNELVGTLQIATGNYAQAVQNLKGVQTNSAALAQVLAKDYSSAATTLANVKNPDALTSYIKAIVAARTNQKAAVVSNLKEAFAQDATLKARAQQDLEFASLFNDASFKNLF